MAFDWLKSFRTIRNSRRRTGGLSGAAETLLESRILLSAAGTETRVNTQTLGSQVQPSIASDADGDYVVVWASQQDGSSYGIYAQRYNAAGVAQGGEFQVNTHTTNSQSHPDVAMDADGDFVVVWHSDGQDGSDFGIYAQRYNAAGTPLGGEFRVNTETNGTQRDPHVAIDADGDAVVVWYSDGQDGGGFGVYGQRFNSSGFQGGEFLVNTTTGGSQALADVAIDTNGNFVVAWHSFGQDGSGYGIYAQRFDASGVAQGVEFGVNTTTANQQTRPSVGMDENGDFVVAWESTAQDGSSDGIYAQRFTSAGITAGSEFLVNTYTTAPQRNPSVSMDAAGDFVVVWESYAQDGEFEGIYAQRYNSVGSQRGSEFRVNSTTTEVQHVPAVTLDSDGDFVIVWESFATDGSGYGIYTQRFRENHLEFAGIWRSGQFYLDSSHNDTWNGSITDTLNYFGNSTDVPIVGDWNGDGYTDIGIKRGATYYLDSNGNGVWDGSSIDKQFNFGNSGDTPIVGDWNKDGKDEIGVWRAGRFYLDFDGNRVWNSAIDKVYGFGAVTDTPIIGDWNGDGIDDIGVWRSGYFYLDSNGNHAWNQGVDSLYNFGNPTDTPVIGDWNADGTDKIGIWRSSQFYLDYNGNGSWSGIGPDYIINFGSATDMPLIGNWRPKTIAGNPPALSLVVNSPVPVQSSPESQSTNAFTLASLIATPARKRFEDS